MRFTDFLLNNYEVIQKADIKSLTSVCTHSDKVKKSSLFIALRGKKSDGHKYLKQAVERGAEVLLLEKTDNVPPEFKGMILKYKDQADVAGILNEFYDFPSKKMFTVGVTGTNGKTSFCYLLEHIFKHCTWSTAVIGTVDQHFKQHQWSSALTTPDPAELFELLNKFVHLGAQSTVIEVSSHALDQNRVEGIDFNAFAFTNLSQDHLDYHGDMESYFQSKRKFFTQSRQKNSFCIVNQDDEYGRRLKQNEGKAFYTYGQDSKSDFCFKIKTRSRSSSVFELNSSFGKQEFHLPLVGDYNVYNAVLAISCALLTGFKAEDCVQALKTFPGVPGRLQKVSSSKNLPFEVLVDYAHTPEALDCVLSALRAGTGIKKIILVFGCGGDRDKGKRKQMTEVALKFADQIFFTTDNPRFEDPKLIIEGAIAHLSSQQKEKITVELDRKTAIKKAIQFASAGDCVLIAGKGHEPFQIVKGKKIPFCDHKIALQCLKELG